MVIPLHIGRPTDADVTDDHNSWIEIDLGEETQVNEVVLKGLNTSFIVSYQISYKNASSSSWVEVAAKDQELTSKETAGFDPVQARYIKVSLDIISSATGRQGKTSYPKSKFTTAKSIHH